MKGVKPMATDYTETRLLVAALDGDEDEAKRLIRQMTHSERVGLQAMMIRIDNWIDEVEEDEREPARKGN
jgi:hypothetical protein